MAEALFRGLRLEIATALNGRWLTLYQTARALGRRSGDIQKALRQMLAEGVLESEHEEPEPGTRFRLAEIHEAALAEALRADQLPGLVQENQELLLLSLPSRRTLDGALARGDVAAVISWGVRLGGNNAMLVAVAPKATETDYARLVSVLEAAQIGVVSYRTATPVDGRALRGMAIASNDAVEATAGDEA